MRSCNHCSLHSVHSPLTGIAESTTLTPHEMPRRKWLGRRNNSSMPPMSAALQESRYPSPPYMTPARGKMTARDEGTAAGESASSALRERDDRLMFESPEPLGHADLDSSYSNTPSTPRRDSGTLGALCEPCVLDATDGQPPTWDQHPDSYAPIIQSFKKHMANKHIPGPPIEMSPPDRTWQSAAAASEIMMFAQRHAFDIVYVMHLYRDAEHAVPLSRFRTWQDAHLGNAPLKSQLLAQYGMCRVSASLEDILQNQCIERHARDGDSTESCHGQIFTFYRKLFDQHPPCLGRAGPRRKITQGVVFAAYRTTSSGPWLEEGIAEQFVHLLVDIYVNNGAQSLLSDPLSKGAELLRLTTASSQQILHACV